MGCGIVDWINLACDTIQWLYASTVVDPQVMYKLGNFMHHVQKNIAKTQRKGSAMKIWIVNVGHSWYFVPLCCVSQLTTVQKTNDIVYCYHYVFYIVPDQYDKRRSFCGRLNRWCFVFKPLLTTMQGWWAGIAQLVRGERSGDRIPVGDVFGTRPDHVWGPPCLLYSDYRVSFPG